MTDAETQELLDFRAARDNPQTKDLSLLVYSFCLDPTVGKAMRAHGLMLEYLADNGRL